MIKPFIIYNATTGEILRHGEATTDPSLQVDAGEAVLIRRIDPAKVDTTYIVDRKLVPRPALDLDALPVGTQAIHNGAVVGVAEEVGPLEIEVDVPGVYQIELRPPFPWLPFTYTVEVP